jgi:hypothetical protein
MSDEYLHFPGRTVRKDDVVAVETKGGWGGKFAVVAVFALYALMAISMLFAFVNFNDIFMPAITGGDGYDDPLSSKLLAFALFALFFGGPILLLAFAAKGFDTGEEKYLKRGRWGAGIIAVIAGLICFGYFSNPNSGLDSVSFAIALVALVLALLVAISTFSWGFVSGHKVVHITLRSGQVLKVDHVSEAP